MDAKDYYGGQISLSNWAYVQYKINFNNLKSLEDVIEVLKCADISFHFNPNIDSIHKGIIERNPQLFVKMHDNTEDVSVQKEG